MRFTIIILITLFILIFNNTADINECQSNPCVHGTCNDLVNGYNCSCTPGYNGTNCQNGNLILKYIKYFVIYKF